MSIFDAINRTLSTAGRAGATYLTFDDNPKVKKLVDDVGRAQAALAAQSPTGWGPSVPVPSTPPGAQVQGPQSSAPAASQASKLLVWGGIAFVLWRLLR